MPEKLIMIKSVNGCEGRKEKFYEKGKVYKIGNRLAKTFINDKFAKYVFPRYLHKLVYFLQDILSKLNNFVKIRTSIKKWYIGEPYENDYSSQVILVGTRRPRLAIRLDSSIKWLKTNRKDVTIMIIGVLLSFVLSALVL